MFYIDAVPPERVYTVGTFLWEVVLHACSRSGNVEPEKLLQQCHDGNAVLWVISEGITPVGVCFTRVVKRGRERGVEITVAGGIRGKLWGPTLQKRMRQYMRDEQATFLQALGRKGWGKVLGLTPVGFNNETGWIFEDYG